MNLLKLTALAIFCMSIASCNSNKNCNFPVPQTPSEALEALRDGNKRYTSQKSVHPHSNMQRVKQTESGQNPFAAVVGCSDSRVPVEIVFDQGIGDIFVIRTAGNNIGGKMVMGSIEYAVEHLGVKVLVVLGHGACGGVTSAVEGGEHQGAIGELIHCIGEDIPEFIGKKELLNDAIIKHTAVQVEEILANPIIAQKVKDGDLIVTGGYYDIHTGVVSFD